MIQAQITQEKKDQIYEAIIHYGTLTRAFKAKALPHKPETIRKWLLIDNDFKEKFEQSRLLGLEELFETALEIAFDGGGDVYGFNKDNRPKISYECVNRSKLKVDTIFRILATTFPAKYSEAFYKPKDRKVRLESSKTNKVEDRLEVIYKSIETGKITPEEGSRIGGLLEIQQRSVENKEILLRLEQLEAAKEKSNVIPITQ